MIASPTLITSSEPDDEAFLIERAMAGEFNAFHQLMKRYNPSLHRTARSIAHNEMDAEDAVQEAWWKAFQHLDGFRGQARFSTWLTRIVINEALTLVRRNKSRQAVIQSQTSLLTGTPVSGPYQDVWCAELRDLIQQHINALPEKYRMVFVLHAIEELSSVEIAEILQVKESTVRVRYMRARQRLCKALRAQLPLLKPSARPDSVGSYIVNNVTQQQFFRPCQPAREEYRSSRKPPAL